MLKRPTHRLASRGCRLLAYSLLVTIPAACARPSPAPEVAPPLVITVVVTPTGGAPAPSPSVSAPAQAGYPAPFQSNITAVYQTFERGFMIYLSDRQAIWVFIRPLIIANTGGTPTAAAPNFGPWMAFADTFTEGQPETDPAIIAPSGFLQPKRGFGKVWRDHPEIREALGWATNYEQPYAAVAADYSIGVFDSPSAYTLKSFIHTISTIDGTLVHVDEAARTWSKP